MVFARSSVWRFKKGKRDEAFAELDRILNTLTRNTEGFRGYISLFSRDNEDTATVLTLWRDLESLNASEKGVFAGAIKEVQESLDSSPKIENFRVFSTELFQRLE